MKGPSLPYLPATHLQKAAAVSLPLFFILPPPFRFFLTASFFPKLLVSWPRRPPSLSQLRDQGHVAAISARNLPAEGGSREFASLFYFFPHHSDFFSQLLFSKIARQLAAPATLPQSIKGSRARRCHTCLQLACIRRRP